MERLCENCKWFKKAKYSMYDLDYEYFCTRSSDKTKTAEPLLCTRATRCGSYEELVED